MTRTLTVVALGALIALTLQEHAYAQGLSNDLPDDEQQPALEPDRLELTPVGSFFSRFETRRGDAPRDATGSDIVRSRARFGFVVDPLDVSDRLQVDAKFTPQATSYWAMTGSTLVDPALGLHEGFVAITTPTSRIQIGRFDMHYGDQLVIGSVDWSPAGRAFDGVRWHLQPADDGPWLDAFVVQVAEGFTGGAASSDRFGEGDVYFLGLYGSVSPLVDDLLTLDLYALSRAYPGADEGPRSRGALMDLTPGFRAAVNAGPFFGRLEAGVQVGGRPDAATGEGRFTTRSVSAHQFSLELGARFADERARASLQGFRASGDDPETSVDEGWDQLYPTAHKWLGLMDVIGPRTNVQGASGHLVIQATGQLRITLDGHAFFADRVPADTERFLGTEVDAGLAWLAGRGLTFRTLYGIFYRPSDAGPSPLHFLEIEARWDLPGGR